MNSVNTRYKILDGGRPSSAGVKGKQELDYLSDPGADSSVEHALLYRIGLLAAQHSRNVEALQRLRSAAPRDAWANGHNLSTPHERSPHRVQNSKIWSPEGNTRSRSVHGATWGFKVPEGETESRRCPKRVTASAESSRKRVPTVMKPFQAMEVHTIAWKKRVQQQKEHDLRMKLEEQGAKEKDRERFAAGLKEGTAFCGVIARSNEMMERRRKKIMESETRDEATRRSYQFKARPVHITDEDWRTIQERQETRRKERCKLRQEKVLRESRLPSRMEKHAKKKKAVGSGEAGDEISNPVETRPTSGSKLLAPERIREMMARKQRLWDKRLAAARLKKKPVVPKTLPMEEREKMYRERAKERAQRERQRVDAARQLEEKERHRRREKAFAARVPVAPRTTHSFLLKTAQVQARINQARDDAKREEQRRLELRAQQRETGRALMEVMKDIDGQQGRLDYRDADRRAKQKARENTINYRNALKENRVRLEKSIAGWPTLLEQHDAAMRKATAKRVALSRVAERVVQSESAGAHWRRGSATDRLFDQEERAMLGIS
ncbi:unnamed protein product [Ascophyllum nodosum]